MLNGTIIKQISNQYTVLCEDQEFICTPRGKFRNDGISPFVGDQVIIDAEHHLIWEIEPRKNLLERPNVSNVDYALIVTSLKQPEISLSLLDKQIANVILHHVKPALCFTKLDLASSCELEQCKKIQAYYEKIGIPVFTNDHVFTLFERLRGALVVLTGQSGAGKSSLLNRLAPELNLKTNEISFSLNRGKHTTRHTELFFLHGVWFCDTPGFSSLDLSRYSKEEIRDSFWEFGKKECQFKDCMHFKEKNCVVKEQVEAKEILESRYLNYVKLIEEVLK